MNLVFVAIGGIAIGGVITFISLRRRRPASMEEGLNRFRQGLDALDPANDPLKRPNGKKDR